ncbi:hypothetical protein [Micromonospora chersina]|uniref:hypothetical protein n=1 Tax=Micromonospora chersina TaxID=47854 RepID=UPI0033A1CCD6
MATEYVNHLADEGKAPSTIDRALSALAVAHRSAGAGRLATDAARAVLRTHRRDSADAGRKVRKAKALVVTAPWWTPSTPASSPASATGRCW